MALASAKNIVAVMISPTTGIFCVRRRSAAIIAPSVDAEITTHITTWPSRSGPSTLPASVAPTKVSAATPPTSNSSPVRARPLSHGRANSTSTANQATPGTATR